MAARCANMEILASVEWRVWGGERARRGCSGQEEVMWLRKEAYPGHSRHLMNGTLNWDSKNVPEV